MRKFLLAMALSIAAAVGAHAQANVSFEMGERNAQQFAYGWGPMQGASVVIGNTATGTQTVTVCPAFRATGDGRIVQIFPSQQAFATVTFDVGTASSETVTPTTVSLVGAPSGTDASQQCASITASFSFTHGASQNQGQVRSGSFGLQEAIDDSVGAGGSVTIDNTWGGTNANIAAATPYSNVSIIDKRYGTTQLWTAQATTATVIAAPTTLTSTTVGFAINGANATGGTYTGASTYHVAIACVDVLGNESQPSADFSGLTAGTGTTNQIGFSAPAAQTGCVGWVPYISLAGGSYALAYRVPLATYSNGVPTGNGVCALTTIETVTAACKITNTTYNQVGVAAIVSALTVNSARIWVGVGGTSSTSDVVGNTNARQTYAYAPAARVGIPGLTETSFAFSAATAPGSTVPAIVGTVHVPPGYMNQVGRSIKICGTMKGGGGSTATVEQFSFYWDADGSNTTGAGVLLPGPTITTTLSATPNFQFCQVLTTTVSGAGATAGSIQTTQGYITAVNGAAGTVAVTTPTVPGAATASLNLAQEARIDIDFLHTTGTDGTETLTNLSVEPFSN